jgi:hypothetical protein
MQFSNFRPIIALLTFTIGASLAWWSASLWERHVYAVNIIGKSLADWSDRHDVTVMINGKPVNRRESFGSALTTKGCIEIFGSTFQEAAPTGPYTFEWRNLSAAIRNSGWPALKLPHPNKVNSIAPEQLAEDLRPLGRLEFVSIYKTD